VVLDLSRVTFMDSTGIHGVVELASHAARLKIDLVVIPGPQSVQPVFELCHLSEFLTFVDAG
jgi:anti-anti-sigma factor